MLTRVLSIALIITMGSAFAVQAQNLQSELQADVEASFDKLIALAETVPAESYSWRPAEGVRSFGEVFVHVAAAGFFFGNMAGVAMPQGLDLQNAEASITSKDDIIALLERARSHVSSGVGSLSADALTQEVEWFGGSTRSARHVLLGLVEHTSEHLGQLIAYSRMNGIAPPWSGA